MTFPDASTRLACVLGHPIAHSLSPPIHNAALRHDGEAGIYLAFDVPGGAFAEAVAGLGALGAAGCNVTIPHKERALELAAIRSAGADRVGAANTLVFGPEGPEAHNTDVGGVLGALRSMEVDPGGSPVLVLGAGGSGKAAAWGLGEAGAAPVLVANRTAERAESLVRALEAAGFAAQSVPWEERGRAASSAAAIVNSTSLGLHGEDAPLGDEQLTEAALGGCRAVLDLVYGHRETPLVRTARGAGLVASDGLEVLVRQAAEAYTLFWGREAPLDVMREAAHRAAGRSHRRPTSDERGVPPLA